MRDGFGFDQTPEPSRTGCAPTKANSAQPIAPLLIGVGGVATFTSGFNPKPGHDFAAIERQLEQPQQHMRCWDKTRIPARFHYGSNPRVPQLVCLADTGWRITTAEHLAKRRGHISLGDHGYDNADPLMRALFVAHGPAFRAGLRVPEFPNVDVYPLMTRLLGLPAAANDGDYEAVKGMLKPAAQ